MDWMTQLAQYVPQTPQEAADKAACRTMYRNMERLCWNAVPLVAAIFAVRG